MSSFDQMSASRSTIRGSQPYDEDDGDAESQFSYVESMSRADLSYQPPGNKSPTATTLTDNAPSQPQPAPGSSPSSSKSASKKLFDEIRDNLDSLNLNLPGFGSRPGGIFKQTSTSSHQKRESYNSSISQYSGKVEAEVEPVSVIQVNQQELLKEEEETGLKRGLSLTKVSSSSPSKHSRNVDVTPKIPQAPSNPGTEPRERSSNVNETPRAPSEASMALGTLETVHVQHRIETPSSQYSDESEGSSDYGSLGRRRSTIKKLARGPDLSTNTNIESTVPPRSSRRPHSGIFDEAAEGDTSSLESSSEKKKKRHSRKRTSLSVTDGLDELMRNANNMSLEQPKGSSASINSNGSAKAIPENSSQERLHTETSHDVYMTADDGSSSEASTEFVPLSAQQLQERQFQQQLLPQPTPLVLKRNSALPPRPTADNIRKAREVSQQISLKELEDQKLHGDLHRDLYDGESNDESGIDRSATLILTQGKFESQQPISPEKEVDAEKIFPNEGQAIHPQSQNELTAASDALRNEKALPSIDSSPDFSKAQLKESERLDPPIQKTLQQSDRLDPPLQKTLQELALGESLQKNTSQLVHPSQGTQKSTALYPDNATVSTTTTPSVGTNALNALEDDEDFYDIEPVTKPARAKSVKQSINTNPVAAAPKPPQQKKKKSSKVQQQQLKSKKHPSRSTSGGLKPFSYQTLISLLESTNGTVIGEEFSQLDLPAKEKQLIEKIIDALSRLSADMVLDRDRYEIGIRRLESALRVLEGFM